MTSSFPNTSKFQVLPTPTTLLLTQSVNNNLTIGNATQTIRQTNTPNGTFIQQQPISSGTVTTPTSIVRLNQPLSTQSQFLSHNLWTDSTTQSPTKLHFTSTFPRESSSPIVQQQTSILPPKIIAQPVVRQTVASQPTPKFTEAQINDIVGKCRTFLITLLKLAEKQAPEKLPMVRLCIQYLLDGTISPESFTERLHTLYKSQPHTSLVPFFKLALPHMRQIVKNTFGRPITIELLEKLNLPSNKSNSIGNTTTIPTSRVIVNSSPLNQQSNSGALQSLLHTTVQPQQKTNLLQQNSQQTLISSTGSLLSQQQQQQNRAQISISGVRPIVTTVSPSSNTNLLTGQQQIQPVTQTIIQQPDSLLQRTVLSSSTTFHQPQIITVSHQPVRTEIVTSQQTSLTNTSSIKQQPQLQQKVILKNEDEPSGDMIRNNGLLTTSSSGIAADDRLNRHITDDNRLCSSVALRQRLDYLVKNAKQWEGGHMAIYDNSVFSLISFATEERLKCLIEQIKSIAKQRINLSIQTQRAIVDSEEMQRTQNKNQHQSSEIILDSGKIIKRKFDEAINQNQQTTEYISSNQSSNISNSSNLNKKIMITKHKYSANLRDMIFIMEKDKYLKRSALLFKILNQSS